MKVCKKQSYVKSILLLTVFLGIMVLTFTATFVSNAIIGVTEWEGDTSADNDFVNTSTSELYYGNTVTIQFNKTELNDFGSSNYYLYYPVYKGVSGVTGYEYNITWTKWGELTTEGKAENVNLNVSGLWFVSDQFSIDKTNLTAMQVHNAVNGWQDIVGWFWVNSTKYYTVTVSPSTTYYDHNDTITVTVKHNGVPVSGAWCDIRKSDTGELIRHELMDSGTWTFNPYDYTHSYGAGVYNIIVYKDVDATVLTYGAEGGSTGYNNSFGNTSVWTDMYIRNSTGVTGTTNEATYYWDNCGPFDPPEYTAQTASLTVLSSSSINVVVDDDADPNWYNATQVKTIQEGINNVSSGGTVFVYSGTYYENVVVNKSITLQGEDRNMTTIDGNGLGDTVNITVDGIIIEGFTITHGNVSSVKVYHASNVGILNCSISNSDFGLFLYYSSNNTISNCTICLNRERGLAIIYSSSNNIVSNCGIFSNIWHGVEVYSSSNNTILNCNISDNRHNGIYVQFSSNNTFTGNIIENNSECGVEQFHSNDNIIYNNSFIENNRSIYIFGFSNRSQIFYNNFIDNLQKPYDEGINSWYNVITSAGNYWSDFDEPSEGAYDNNSDGIVDSPYNISGGSNLDMYPFINESLWETPSVSFVVDKTQRTLTVLSVDNPYTLWDHIDVTGLCNTSGLSGYVTAGDQITECHGAITVVYKPVNELLDVFNFPLTYFVDDDFNMSTSGWHTTKWSNIQDAINNATDGDTVFVYNGTYYDNLIINKTINLVGENRKTTIIDGNQSENVIRVTADWVNISSFTIQNGSGGFFGISTGVNVEANHTSILNNLITNNTGFFNAYGIYIDSYNNNTIYGNTIVNNGEYGIYLYNSSNNNISNNKIFNNSDESFSPFIYGYGVYLRYSDGNTIMNNFISNQTSGAIYLYHSSNNTVKRNEVYAEGGNTGTVSIRGVYLDHSRNNTFVENSFVNCSMFLNFNYVNVHELQFFIQNIENNTVNGKPLYYYKNQSGFSVPSDAGAVIVVNCSNVSLDSIGNISHVDAGVQIIYSDDVEINNSRMENSSMGIVTFFSNNTRVNNNTLSNNLISIYNCLSSNATFSDNDIGDSLYGCYILLSNDTLVLHNNIHNNTLGVIIYISIGNNVSNNIFFNDSISIRGEDIKQYIHIIENNTVNDKPFYYYKNQSSFAVPEDAGGVILVNCTNATVQNLNMSYIDIGVNLAYCQGTLIRNNNISNALLAMFLYHSNNNTLYNNDIHNNSYNQSNSYSINIYSIGLYLYYSTNNSIFCNNFTDNYYGVSVSGSDNNSFYHNNFIDNTLNA
ncbi:MAG: right-handed parallel beta-helix repeat-containing protein, partial [Thermoplasmata archaeon]|nr:right-handed parallel beta-helix repeat-containing protein [Thermoplasmata archaeon]